MSLTTYTRNFGLSLTVVLLSALTGLGAANDDPDKVKFVTSDIDNFWRAYDLVQKEPDHASKVAIYQREYIDKGSAGLKGFMRGRIQSAENLLAVIEHHSAYYASIRGTTLHLAD